MREINFQNIDSKTNIFIAFLIVLCVVINSLVIFEYINFANSFLNKLFPVLTYSFCAIYISRIFWYKNIFQWNRNGFTARINNFWGLNKKFKEISKIEYDNNCITFIDVNGMKDSISLENIESSSKSKLIEILQSKIK